MEKLFERYASVSGDVQRYLSILEKRIQEEKAPGDALVQGLNNSLDQLSALWADIAQCASEQMPGVASFSEDSSISTYREAWNKYCHSHDIICAVLTEFLDIYSTDQRYMDALRPTLFLVERIIEESSIDTLSASEVQNYRLFLRGVKEFPANDEALVHQIEDRLYTAFPPIAVSGLLQGKYDLRKPSGIDAQTELDGASDAVGGADEAEDGALPAMRGDGLDEPLAQTVDGAAYLSPRLPISEAKLPSDQKFNETVTYCAPVLIFLLDSLAFSGLIERATVDERLMPANSIDSIGNMIDRLEKKGFLSVYERDGKTFLCFTKLMADCLVRKGIRSLLKRTFPKAVIPQKILFTAKNEIDVKKFDRILSDSKTLYNFIDRLNAVGAVELFPKTSNQRYWEDGAYSAELHREGCGVLDLRLADPDAFASTSFEGYDGIVCGTDDLYALDMSGVDDEMHYCVADRAYRWVGGQWVPLVPSAEAPEENAPAEAAVEKEAPAEPIADAEDALEKAVSGLLSDATPDENAAPSEPAPRPEQDVNDLDARAQRSSGTDIASGVSHYRAVAIECALRGRMDVASVIFRSLSYYDAAQINPVLRRFALATGDPAYHGSRSVNGIQTAFDLPCGADPVYDLLSAAAHLRMFFSSAVSENPYLAYNITHLQNSLAFERYPQLNKVFFALSGFVEKQQRGLDAFLLEKVIHSNRKTGIQQSLQKKAEEILGMRLTESKHGYKQLKKNRELLFGKDSDIYKALRAIRDGEQNAFPMAEFSQAPDVDKYIDEYWAEASRKLNYGVTEPCTGGERKTLTRQLRDIFALFEEYARLTNIHKVEKDGQIEAAIQSIDTISANMKEILDLPAADESEASNKRAADTVLRCAIRDCLARISGEADETAQQRSYYIELLKEPLVALESMTEPYIEQPGEEIFPFDFCERAARYLDAPARNWEDTVKRLLNDRSDAREGMDYGDLRILSEYLSEIGYPELAVSAKHISEKIAQAQSKDNIIAQSSYLRWQQDFDARLELADGDNWFESDLPAKVQLTNSMRRQHETYISLDNYGFYGRAMLRILKRLDEEASELCEKYRDKLSRLKEKRSEEELAHPIFGQIRSMIEAKRFGAAESYMQLVRDNHLDIEEGSLRRGRFDEFIEALNGSLFRVTASGKSPARIYEDRHGSDTSQYRSGLLLLKQWPESQPGENRVGELLTELGLDVQKVEAKDSGLFTVTFREPKGVVDYPHPIAAFGSNMYHVGLDVCYITGKRDDEALIATISEKLRLPHGNRQLLVLADFAVSIDNRRKLADALNKSFSEKRILLIDRCLILFLADIYKSERWKVALRCALPFCVINPYFEDSKLEIPPEMFIGRQDEIRSIISPEGPNLLSGGRQLGKTAILQRARFQENDPAEHKWAIFADIKDKDYAQASESICKALRYDGFFPDDHPDVSDWNALIDSIERRLMDRERRQDKLLLLLDEADRFITLSADDGYKPFERLRELQRTTGGRFKFVMAGLHNVLRFYRNSLGGNSVLPQFSCVPIWPLKFADARELLEKPLSFLGFTIEPGQEDIIAQILYNTNYFPGLIQFYASSLIKNVLNNSSPLKNPPYRLTRDVLLRLLSETEFIERRKERLMMTLTVDEKDAVSYYYVLAIALAYCSYQDENVMLYGATAQEIRAVCVELHPQCSLADLTDKQIEELLEELVGLNILRSERENGKCRYLFSRSSFLEMLGEQEEVENKLIDSLEKGADAK